MSFSHSYLAFLVRHTLFTACILSCTSMNSEAHKVSPCVCWDTCRGLLQCEAVRTGWDKGGGGTLTLNTVYCWQHIHTECWFHVHPIINLSPSLSPPPFYNCAASETIVFTPQTRRESHQWPTGRQTNTHTVHSSDSCTPLNGFCSTVSTLCL